MVRTMSKTFSVPMPIVVRTTTSAARMLGRVMNRNILKPWTPSSLAASMISSGIALIAAESTVIAKPAWIHTMTMMSIRVLSGALRRNCWVSKPSALRMAVEQADLRAGRLLVLVDELPDDAGADHGDRHRQEDQRLGERLAAGPVDEDRVEEPDAGREERHEDDPQGRVAQDEQQLGLGEHRGVVVEAERASPERPRRDWMIVRIAGYIRPTASRNDRGRRRRATPWPLLARPDP